MLERESHSQVSSVFASRLSWPAVRCCISAKRGMMKPLATAVVAPSLPKRPPQLGGSAPNQPTVAYSQESNRSCHSL